MYRALYGEEPVQAYPVEYLPRKAYPEEYVLEAKKFFPKN